MKMGRESEIVELPITFDEIPKALPRLTIPEPIKKVINDYYTYIGEFKEKGILPDEEYEVFVQGFKEISGVFCKNGMDSTWNSLVELNEDEIEGADVKFDNFSVAKRAQKIAYILLFIKIYVHYVYKSTEKQREHIKDKEKMIEQIKLLKETVNKHYLEVFDACIADFGHEYPEKKFIEILEAEQKRLEDEIVKHNQSIKDVKSFMSITRQSKNVGKSTVYIKILSHAFRVLYGNSYSPYVKQFIDVIFPTPSTHKEPPIININSIVSRYKKVTDNQKMPYENLLFSSTSVNISPVIHK